MTQSIDNLLSRLWVDYKALNPQAGKIHELLTARGEAIVNDHIALRTYDDPRCNIEVLARPFLAGGYQPRDEYVFTEKKLLARHYTHSDANKPKVFISQLKLAEFSPALSERVKGLLDQVTREKWASEGLVVSGRPWTISYAQYEALLAESEYAGWVSAFGFRANHFTVLVNALKTFKTLAEFNAFLKQSGFALNAVGGEIKGSPAVFLEQSSTLAAKVPVPFSDGHHTIPSCYYEFALRYKDPATGKLFEGFVEKSADKIFESTNKR